MTGDQYDHPAIQLAIDRNVAAIAAEEDRIFVNLINGLCRNCQGFERDHVSTPKGIKCLFEHTQYERWERP